MIEEPYFFEIPVYRCNRQEYTEDLEERKAKLFHGLPSSMIESTANREILNFHYSNIWKPYDYNEIIGYIGLYVLGSQIRGHYYFIKGQVRKNRVNKRFEQRGKAFEHTIHRDRSNEQIFEEIIQKLKKINNVKPFAGRHIDLQAFLIVGVFLDWRALLDKLNSFDNPRIKY
jgi:hypothetical protein